MATNAPVPVVVVDLSLTLGAIFVGDFIAVALWGMHCIQTVYYFMHYPRDNVFLKGWVTLLWCLDTVHQIVSIKGIWKPLIKNYGNYISLLNIEPELVYQTLVTAVVAFMAQCYFMRRIYLFNTSPYLVIRWGLPILLSPLIVWQLVGTIIYTVRGLGLQTSAQLGALSRIAIGINASAAAVDIIIALFMCFLLHASQNGIPATNRLLHSLMISSLITGAWTAIFAIITVSLVAGRPNDLLYSITYFPLCSLYCNTILGNLTSRDFIRRLGIQTTVQTGLTTTVLTKNIHVPFQSPGLMGGKQAKFHPEISDLDNSVIELRESGVSSV